MQVDRLGDGTRPFIVLLQQRNPNLVGIVNTPQLKHVLSSIGQMDKCGLFYTPAELSRCGISGGLAVFEFWH